MDIHCADNLYDSFCVYQTRLLDRFDSMADEFGFITIDATRNVSAVQTDLRRYIKSFLINGDPGN